MEVAKTDADSPGRSGEAAGKLEDAIREIVRQELHRPVVAEPEKGLQPNWRDALWLAIFLINIALLLWWLPESILKSERLSFLAKLVPWLGSYLFVVGYAWARDRILEFSRSKRFIIVQAVALMVLIPLFVSQLRVFNIHPVVEPHDAIVRIDNSEESTHDSMWLSLGRHDVVISDSTDSNRRSFHLTRRDFFKSWLGTSEGPHWALCYEVKIITLDPETEVIIEKLNGDFDPDFLAQPIQTKSGLTLKVSREEKVTLQFKGTSNLEGDDETVRLPYGKYRMTARRVGCQQQVEKQVDVPGEQDALFSYDDSLCTQSNKRPG